jgi:ubiquitin-protein ligase
MDVSTNSKKSEAPQHAFSKEVRCVHGAVVEGIPASACADDDAVIAAPAPTNEDQVTDQQEGQAPAEIIPEETKLGADVEDEQEDDDESEYEYEDDDDAAFSGFLLASEHHKANPSPTVAAPARIVEEETTVAAARKKWREPTRAAVNMSLRAQRETCGSKRRLAQDLYRIMNQDTVEAGFSLAPQSEDSMDKWTIKLFKFDEDSNLAKDMLVLGVNSIELEMKFPDQYPFEPPFVRVVKPRFKRQTGFVMNGALCMELLTKDGWNPINDIESVIVSIRSLLVVGDGRLQGATDLSDPRYEALLKAVSGKNDCEESSAKRRKFDDDKSHASAKPVSKEQVGTYSSSEAQAAYSHLSAYHKKKGWDTSGWWAKKG